MTPSSSDQPVTYASYLALDQILTAQAPRSDGPEHDEMLFIVIHQVYELWFKQILHELDHLIPNLSAGRRGRALETLRRILTILKTLVAQIDVLETMTPLQFLSFRDRLESGSGFQSAQFRAIEFTLGWKRPAVLKNYPAGTWERAMLDARLAAPTLWDAFLRYLAVKGYAVPEAGLARDVREPIRPSPALQRLLIDIYHKDASPVRVAERLVDLDEGLQEWRYRHVKMVERTIGTKPGTGGSSGVGYLRQTLMQPIFPDLWAIRGAL